MAANTAAGKRVPASVNRKNPLMHVSLVAITFLLAGACGALADIPKLAWAGIFVAGLLMIVGAG